MLHSEGSQSYLRITELSILSYMELRRTDARSEMHDEIVERDWV
jgi:hypothetical protein